jgi:autotransporter-associated beta strand protein
MNEVILNIITKYKINTKIFMFTFILLFTSFLFFGNVKTVEAAVRTWTGSTSDLWSVAGNWGGTVPVTGDDLVFPDGASNLSNTNDLTENTIFNSITFSGSGYTISGNRIILGPGLAGITDSVSSGGNTISLDIRLDVTRDIVVTNTAETLTISGRITGVGGITKEGTGTLVLSGANTYGGITKINVGVINARHSTALGTIALGTEIVGNAALELQGGINISYEPLALRGYGVSNNGALRNISDDNTFGGLITLSSAGGTEISSDSGTLTITGGTTGNLPLVFDGAGNITFSKAPLAGSGAITKNGVGTVRYNFPNTNTGLLTINQGTILYGVDNAILSSAITVTSGTLDIATYSDIVGTVTLGTLDLASGTITGSTGMLSSTTWTVYNGTISAIISGDAGTLTKSTPGTVILTRPNQYTGATTISAGILEIQDSMSLGLIDGITTVTAGATLQINGDGLSIPEYITFSGTGLLYTGAIRNKTGNNTITGLLTLGTIPMIKSDSGTTLTIDGKGLSATTVSLTIGGDGNTTFTSTAPIYGTTAALTKNDNGILTIQSFSNFTGATNINRGEIILSDAGAIPLSTITINSGGTLTLNNSSTAILNRISDTLALTINDGSFNFIGNTTAQSSETAGALTLSTGHSIVTVTPGAGGPTTMTFASLTRTAGASVLFRGTSLGSTPGANVSTLMFTSTPAVLGASGAAGTTTISVIKGAFGDNSLSGTGTDMVVHNLGNTNGLRLLNSAGFSGEYSTTLTTNTNVKLSGDVVASTASINSLILNGFNITNPGSAATITISNAGTLAGNILINSTTNIAGANTTLGITTNELNILATANSTISAIIGTAVAGSLTISGSGNITLSTASLYTGTTFINDATLTYGASNILSSGGVTVVHGTLNINGSSDTVGAVILQNGTITGGAGILTGTSYSFREGTVSAIIAGTGAVVTRIATSAPADSVVTMTRDNTYTGATTITSGILKLGAAGGGTNTPFGTSAGGITIAGSASLDLNGFTLGTAEAITSMTGLGFGPGTTVANGNSNMGALMNSSSTPVGYSGTIAMVAASRINADAGVITISGNISGAFGLTIGGFSNSTFSGIIGSGALTITKDGIGTLTLSGNNSYTGATTISVGTVKLGSNGSGSNTPLGTTGAATIVSLGARLDLNGFTLTTAEALTLNGVGYGLGDFASGALMNSSGSSVTHSGLITLGSTGVLIKADYGNISLTAAGTISGSGFSLTLGGSGIGSLSSIIGTVGGAVTKINTGTWTLSGASTFTGAVTIGNGTVKLGATGATTNTPLGVIAGTTSVMSGAVLDLNGFTLTAAEPLILNGRGIGNGGALVNNSGSGTTYSGGVTQATDSRITNSGAGLLTLSGAVSGAFALYIGGAGNITTSAVIPAAALSITKQGAGTLTVTGANLYTGITRVDEGTFAYAATTTLVGTNLIMNGGIFNNGANADTIGTVTLIGGTITNSAALTAATSYTLESGTVSGILAGAIPIIKNTNNTVTLTGVNTVSSTTTINAGTLVISGSGSATTTTITVNLGGTLTLDNSTTAVASRLGDALALTLNGGNFNFIGNSAAASSETTGALTLLTGHNIVTVTPGTGGSTTMTFASLARTAGATVLFRGTSLGSNAAANISTLVFTATPTLTGAGGASGSATVSIIKGAYGDTSLTGTGSDMVTYQGGVGLRLLNGAGFSGEYTGDLQTANANVKLTADRVAVATNTSSLILNGFAITNPGSAITIPISSASLAGNILINSATNIAGANTTLGITTTELDILATSNSTISAIIGTAVAGSVAISGTGNVTLSAANLYTGTTFVNNATLTAAINNITSSGGITLRGATYNLNGNSDTIGALSVTASNVATGAGTLTLGGDVTSIANGNFSSKISGNLGLGANRIFNIGDGLMDNDLIVSAIVSGAFTVTKSTGTGVLIFSGSNSYTGLTTVSAGILRLGASGGATNTPLGTTGAGTTISGASSALDLNGYTLGTTEALTLSGALATGALQNTSSTNVNYSGLITLGAASTIISNYGDINITNGGNITGSTFALTIGGAGNGTLASNLNTGTGTLIKNGLGVWTISGAASTFTGLTTISAGTLKLGSAGSGSNTPLGTSAGGITITSGAVFDLNGFTLATAEPIGSLNGTGIANIGAFINSSNNSISYSGVITPGATARIANHGNGTWTLTGNIVGSTRVLTFVTVGNMTQSSTSVWSGTSTGLIKEGSGTLILAGQNSFTTGTVTVSTGVLQLGASGGATNTPLGTSGAGTTVSAGAVLNLSTYSLGGASTYETLNLSGSGIGNGGALISTAAGNNNFGAVTVAANTRVVNSGSGQITFGGTVTIANSINLNVGGTGPILISGVFGATATSATLTKRDSGTLTISAASITTGLVRINGGTLAYGILNALATPAVIVAGGTLNLNGFNETNIGAVTLIGNGSIVNTGAAATLTSTATYTLESGTISAVLGGTVVAAIIKNTAGRVILSGDNSFSGTAATIAVNAGYLNLRHNNALGASASANTTTVLGGATLELENNITIPSVKALTVHGTGIGNGGAIRNVSGSNTISANVALGTTNVRINSDSGTLTIPTISGNTFNSIFGGAGSVTVTGVISTTSGNLTKDGAGSTTLSGTNTYTGSTTIILGTIVANTTASIGNGTNANNILIFKGGALQATGTITSPSTRVINLYGNGTIDTNGNSVSLAGTVGSIGGLTKNGLGTLTITNTTTIGGDLTISNGTLVAPTTLTINGDFDNSGTFTHSNGTVTLAPTDSTKTTNILGSSDTTFYNLTNTTAGSTIQLKAGNTYTFANNLTLTGTESSPISINSDTPDSQWLMTLSGSNSISYLKVKDSGCSGGNTVSSSSTIYDYGNNGACWSFVSTIIKRGGGSTESSATPDSPQSGGDGGGSGGSSENIESSGTPDGEQNGGGGGGGGSSGDLGLLNNNEKTLVFLKSFDLGIIKNYLSNIFIPRFN